MAPDFVRQKTCFTSIPRSLSPDLEHRLSPGLGCKCLDLFCSDGALSGLILQCLDYRLADNINFEWLLCHRPEESKLIPEERVELRGDETTHCDWQRKFSAGVIHETRTYEDASQVWKGGCDGCLCVPLGGDIPGRQERCTSSSRDVDESRDMFITRFLG